MVNNHGIIILKAGYKKGSREASDYVTFIKTIIFFTPKQITNVFDFGYSGVEKDYSHQISSLPYKKKKNQELSKEQKQYNQ